jgi:predicted nucleic acid-binding protein
VAAKWFLDDEADTAAARFLFARFAAGELTLVVPDCFFYEVAGLLQRAERRQRISVAQADLFITRVEALPDRGLDSVGSQELIREAFTWARELHGSVYDAMYLLVAKQRGIPFVTADDTLYRKVAHLPFVRLLSDERTA